MKLHIISDLHLEFSEHDVQGLEADVIVLAGDIGVGMKGLEWAAKLLSRTDTHIIYVAGNHEFYRHEINSLRKAMKSYCSAPVGWTGDDSEHRLHFLDDDEVIINGVRFLGSTMWTDFKLFGENMKEDCMSEGERRLNDFRLISILEGADRWYFSPQDSIDLHNQSLKWLSNKLKNEPFDGQTVVVTHHLPSQQSVVERFKESLVSACFASDLDDLFGYSDLWIHGHTHDSLDYVQNGTRVICNPRGYSRTLGVNENDSFDPKLIIEIDTKPTNETGESNAQRKPKKS
jgi:predicted phosphodiesterase